VDRAADSVDPQAGEKQPASKPPVKKQPERTRVETWSIAVAIREALKKRPRRRHRKQRASPFRKPASRESAVYRGGGGGWAKPWPPRLKGGRRSKP